MDVTEIYSDADSDGGEWGAAAAPSLEGWMFKKGKHTGWKKRWFVLREGQLRYFKNRSSRHENGSISLVEGVLTSVRESKHKKKYPFTISSPNLNRAYEMYCETLEDRDRWLGKLEYYRERRGGARGRAGSASGAGGGAAAAVASRRSSSVAAADLSYRDAALLDDGFLSSKRSAWRSPLSAVGLAVAESSASPPSAAQWTSLPPAYRVRRPAAFAVHSKFNCAVSGGADGADTVLRAVSSDTTGRCEEGASQPDEAFADRFSVLQDGSCFDLAWRGRHLLSASSDGRAFLYDAPPEPSAASPSSSPPRGGGGGGGGGGGTGELLATFGHAEGLEHDRPSPAKWLRSSRVRRVRFQPGKENFLSACGSHYYLWNMMRPEQPVHAVVGSGKPCLAAAWNPHRGGHEFVLGGVNCALRMRDDRQLNPSKSNTDIVWKVVHAHGGAVRDVAWSPFVSHWLASAGDDGCVHIWDLRLTTRHPATKAVRSPVPVRTLSMHAGAVSSVAWCRSRPDTLLTGCSDRRARLWNLRVAPHHVTHSHEMDDSVVGVAFSPVHPMQLFAADASGDLRSVTLRRDFVERFAHHRPPSSSSSSSSSSSGNAAPALERAKDERAHAEIDRLLYARDLRQAYQLIGEQASRYWSKGEIDRAERLLKLVSMAPFQNAAEQPTLKRSLFAKLLDDVSYYVPDRTLKLSQASEADRALTKLLMLRVALVRIVSKGKWRSLVQMREEIVHYVGEDPDAFDARTLAGVVHTVLRHDYLQALEMAIGIGEKLSVDSGHFSSKFVGIARELLYPTVYHPLRRGDPVPAKAEALIDRELRNPKTTLSLLELLFTLQRASDLSGPDAANMIVVQMRAQNKDRRELRKVLPATAHRLFYNALLARHNYDMLYILALRVATSLQQYEFSGWVTSFLEEVAYPRFVRFLDDSERRSPARPWETQALSMAALTVVNTLYCAENLPERMKRELPPRVGRLTALLKRAFVEVCRHPGYVPQCDPPRDSGRMSGANDAVVMCTRIQFSVNQLRKKKKVHEPAFDEQVERLEAMVEAMMEEAAALRERQTAEYEGGAPPGAGGASVEEGGGVAAQY